LNQPSDYSGTTEHQYTYVFDLSQTSLHWNNRSQRARWRYLPIDERNDLPFHSLYQVIQRYWLLRE
jgi:hypothetical protein